MIYEFADCTLDTGTQQLRRDGEPVHVEPQVLAVLAHLAANSDRMVSKVELLDEVWGDRFVSESALTSRIKLARKACGDSGREQRIVKTIHGRGYRMVADVAAGAVSPERASRAETAAALSTTTGIVGREAELAELADQLAAVRDGDRRTVFVTGEVGVGKSTLVAEFVERDDEPTSPLLLRGQCLRARSGVEPYFCLLDALAHLSRSDRGLVRTALERVAPLWLTQLPELVDDDLAERLERRTLGATPLRMVREGAGAFEELARRHPAVLVIEDLHWADDCTLDVVGLLGQRADPAALMVVATMRNEPGAALDLMHDSVAQGAATPIHLDRLDRPAIGALAASRSGGSPPAEELLEILAERSQGVPLFAVEILNSWERECRTSIVEAELVMESPARELAASVPDALVALIERSLGDLDPDEIRALEAAAVAGISFDGASVAAGLRRPIAEVEATLDRLARRADYLSAEGGSRWPDGTGSTNYAFTHSLHRDTLIDRIPHGRQIELHRMIGSALEKGFESSSDDMATILAEHFSFVGDWDRAVRHLLAAGQQAISRSAHDHAVTILEEATQRVTEIAPGPDRDRTELRIRVGLGLALVATRGWFDDTVPDNYERALELAAAVGPGPDASAARYGMATVTELRGQFERTEALLAPLLAEEATGDLAMEAHELMACSAFHQGNFAKSAENSGAVLDSWDDDTYSVLMARIAEHPASSCNSWLSVAAWYLGRSDDSVAHAEKAVDLGERNLYALTTATSMRAMLHQLRHEPAACLEWADRTQLVAGEQHFPMRVIQADMFRGWALGVSGSPDDGVGLITDGLYRFRAAGARLNEAYYLAMAAETHLHGGPSQTALTLLDEALALTRDAARSYFYECDIHRLRAHALMAFDGRSRADEAVEALDTAESVAEDQASPALILRVLTDRLELGIDGDRGAARRARLVAILSGYDGQAPTPDVERARAVISR